MAVAYSTNPDGSLKSVAITGSDGGAPLDVGGADVSASNPLPVTIISGGASTALPAGTNKSGSITTGGTAQTLAASNSARVALTGQNIDASADLWINETGGTAAANTAGSFKVAAGGTFSISTNQAISIVGATTGQKFSATEV
jgi:hypothetical protein